MRTINQTILGPIVVVILTFGVSVTARSQVSGKPLATIPVEVTSYGGVILNARINNSAPMSFYLDSGASSPFVINIKKATALGLKVHGRLSREGGAGPNAYEASRTSPLTIALGNVTFADQTADVFSLDLIEEQFGRPVDGLVGINLFLKYVVEIDYEGKTLRLYDPGSYVYSGTGEAIALTLRNGHFLIPVKIDIQGSKKLEGQFVVDTGGCLITAVLTAPFSSENGLPTPSQKTITDRSISGLGGETRLLVSRSTSFTIGGSVLPAALIYISQDKAGALASSEFEGLIGTEILRKFKLIFDYARRRLILEHNLHFDEPSHYDMSGLSVRAFGDDFRIFKVYRVLEGSPAGETGLRSGDIIEEINGVPASRLTLEQILQMTRVPGREYELTIKRGSHSTVVKLRTRRLI